MLIILQDQKHCRHSVIKRAQRVMRGQWAHDLAPGDPGPPGAFLLLCDHASSCLLDAIRQLGAHAFTAKGALGDSSCPLPQAA